VSAHPFGGYTNAKDSSTEAGMQKLLTALPCILAGGCNIDAGLLGDSICSPIQMILDSELISALRRVLRGFIVSDDTLGIELINEVGPGGTFTDTNHTVQYLRSEIWQPGIWNRETHQSWLAGDRKTDIERAFDFWIELMGRPESEPSISEEMEENLGAVIDQAARTYSL